MSEDREVYWCLADGLRGCDCWEGEEGADMLGIKKAQRGVPNGQKRARIHTREYFSFLAVFPAELDSDLEIMEDDKNAST